MRIKNWTPEDVEAICLYLSNSVRDGGMILRLRNRKGVRAVTLAAELELASTALRTAVARADDGGFDLAPVFEQWIAERLIEGGRERLLGALRQRQHRAAAPAERQHRAAAPAAERQHRADRIAALEAKLALVTKRLALYEQFCGMFSDAELRTFIDTAAAVGAGAAAVEVQARREERKERQDATKPDVGTVLWSFTINPFHHTGEVVECLVIAGKAAHVRRLQWINTSTGQPVSEAMRPAGLGQWECPSRSAFVLFASRVEAEAALEGMLAGIDRMSASMPGGQRQRDRHGLRSKTVAELRTMRSEHHPDRGGAGGDLFRAVVAELDSRR